MPSKAIAGGLGVAGLAIMIGCAVPMSKETDKTSSKYKGLTAGVVIGVLMIVAGLVMMFMGGGGGASPAGNGSTIPSEKVGSAAVAIVQDPLNIATKTANATELSAALNAQKANNMVAKAGHAKETLAKLKGIFGSMAGGGK